MTGRPPIPFDQEIADDICDQLAESSKGLAHLCSLEANRHWPSARTIARWRRSNAAFAEQFADATMAKADFLADEVLSIADEENGDAVVVYGRNGEVLGAKMDGSNVRRAEVKIATRKWLAGILNPAIYGQRMDVTSGGQALAPSHVTHVTIDQRVQTIMLMAADRKRAEAEAQDLLG